MTGRERFLKALQHEEPDRVPIHDNPWPETVWRQQREGLPAEIPVSDYFDYELVIIGFDQSPMFEVKTLHKDETYIVETTPYGGIRKNFRTYSSTPEIVEWAVKTKKDWLKIKERLSPDFAPDYTRVDWSGLMSAFFFLLLLNFASPALSLRELLKRVNHGPWCVKTLSATLNLEAVDKTSLERVGEGLSRIFALRMVKFYFQQPDRIRVESLGPLKLAFIVSGEERALIGPGIYQVRDLKKDPGKKQYSFEFGFLSRGVWEGFKPVVLGRAKVGGRRVVVLKLVGKTISGYRMKDRKVYIDERTGAILKLVRLGRSGNVEAVRVFSGLKWVAPGLFLPTKATLLAGKRTLAGYMTMTEVEANRPLPPSLFAVKGG